MDRTIQQTIYWSYLGSVDTVIRPGAVVSGFLDARPWRRFRMPRRYPPETPSAGDRARSETKVEQLAEVFGVSGASIYSWLKQDRIDHGELEGLSTDQTLELALHAQAARAILTPTRGPAG
jgi:transposase-like protein